MKTVKNILVALDLTSLDTQLIKYASFLAEQLNPEMIYFVHNIKKYEISGLFQEQLKELNLEQAISDELDEKVQLNYHASTPSKVLISEDSYTESLINYIANKYSIDLVVLGNKKKENGTGVVSDKLMRLLKCDIISIPAQATLKLDKIWIGTDFSKESLKAFKVAHYLESLTNATLTAANIYNVPIQFSPYMDREEMLPKIERHTREKFDKFLKKQSFEDIYTETIRGRDCSVAEKLSEEAEKAAADLLVVADKGGNVFSSLLVGSVTNELFDRSMHIPLWIAK